MKVAQLCPTLCDLMDYRVHGFLQARILEWVAFPFFKGSSQPRIKPRFPALQADSLPAEPPGKPNQANGTLVSAQRYVPSLHTFSSETQNKHWPPAQNCTRISGRQGLHTPEASVSCLSFRVRSPRWNRAPSQKRKRSNKTLNSSVSQILVDVSINDEASLHVG